MPKKAAGIILYRFESGVLQVLLGHMGGPRHADKHAGSWSVPKGELEKGEDAREAAMREFEEEVGFRPTGDLLELTKVTQTRSGKCVFAWAVEGAFDPIALHSNNFSLEWPVGSGKFESHPEIDKAAWLTIPEAMALAIPGQAPLFQELEQLLAADAEQVQENKK